MSRPTDADPSVVLVGGHESSNGADLHPLLAQLPGAHVTAPGRALSSTVSRVLSAPGQASVVVLPITFGRNPTMVADAAKTLSWLAPQSPGRLALAEDFGTLDHLTAWLRAATVAVRRRAPDAAVVIAAESANPFDDAELHRIAHLVRTHGAGNEVEAAAGTEPHELLVTLRRLRLLGFPEAVVVPAGFQRSSAVPFGKGDFAGAEFYGPLLSEQAVLRVIRDRVADAAHRLSHGDDGINAGLAADHGHGYAHSHAFDASGFGDTEGAGHTHPHTHSHGDGRGVAHTHNHSGAGHDHPEAASGSHPDMSLIHTQ
ncbi:hypothetical protein GY24_07155 [Microterricola pindariensis]|uniref:Cobalamin biosynthesis protein CbiX n=1 Tax=Microterricola pindariensis TaxID=478010 RepID=A0ABX5AWE4_9MICO|nr:hypothetical protein GY24_07155 [Microterricola pindariensis]